MRDVVGQDAVAKALSAVRANPHSSFDEQARHLQCLLENLPVLGHNAATLQLAREGSVIKLDIEGVLEQLKEKWVCGHGYSQEGAIHAEIEATDQLVIKFYMYLWGKMSEVGHFQIVRQGEEEYLYQDCGQTGK
jgi:hypothetical protein